jgi:hypothetical protein
VDQIIGPKIFGHINDDRERQEEAPTISHGEKSSERSRVERTHRLELEFINLGCAQNLGAEEHRGIDDQEKNQGRFTGASMTKRRIKDDSQGHNSTRRLKSDGDKPNFSSDY